MAPDSECDISILSTGVVYRGGVDTLRGCHRNRVIGPVACQVVADVDGQGGVFIAAPFIAAADDSGCVVSGAVDKREVGGLRAVAIVVEDDVGGGSVSGVGPYIPVLCHRFSGPYAAGAVFVVVISVPGPDVNFRPVVGVCEPDGPGSCGDSAQHHRQHKQ